MPCVCSCILLFGAFAQGTNLVPSGNFHFGGPDPYPIPAIAGAPYCADRIREFSERLSDGTQKTRPVQVSHICRDSSGRIGEDNFFTSDGSTSSPLIIRIFDPVAGYQYTLDLVHKVAHRVVLTPAGARPAISRNPADVSRAKAPLIQLSRESLGTQTMEGLRVEGHLDTETVPAGAHNLSDGPLVVTTEWWRSTDLKEILLSKLSHPRSTSVTRMTRIVRGEPAPELFQVPSGFTTIEETGPFWINLNEP
jgi:hypothetical protein